MAQTEAFKTFPYWKQGSVNPPVNTIAGDDLVMHGARAPAAMVLPTLIGIFQFQHQESYFNTLRLRQNGRHFPDNIFKVIFIYQSFCILIKISLKFIPQSPINNIPALVQIMAWRRQGDKPLSESMMVSLLTHISITRPQWVKYTYFYLSFISLWL